MTPSKGPTDAVQIFRDVVGQEQPVELTLWFPLKCCKGKGLRVSFGHRKLNLSDILTEQLEMKRSRSLLIAAVGLVWLLAGPLLHAQVSSDTQVNDRIETGKVRWQRDLERSKAESKATGKPVFLLLQEIPGCQTCQDFGKGPLSHPLLVEAIETEFVPVLVYNNRQGRDAVLLKQYDEPSWNNPVVRYVDGAGEDLIKRKDRIWTIAGTAQRMIQSLESADRRVPDYLRSLADSLGPTETATFAMHCFWRSQVGWHRRCGQYSFRLAFWLGGGHRQVSTSAS